MWYFLFPTWEKKINNYFANRRKGASYYRKYWFASKQEHFSLLFSYVGLFGATSHKSLGKTHLLQD